MERKLENANKSLVFYEKWVERHDSFPPRRFVNELPLSHLLEKNQSCLFVIKINRNYRSIKKLISIPGGLAK